MVAPLRRMALEGAHNLAVQVLASLGRLAPSIAAVATLAAIFRVASATAARTAASTGASTAPSTWCRSDPVRAALPYPAIVTRRRYDPRPSSPSRPRPLSLLARM